jgi:hypothetical protein
MPSPKSTTPPLHVLRAILRRLKTKPEIKGGGNRLSSELPITRRFVLQRYRAAVDAPPEVAEKLRKIARDYSMLQKDLQERKRLYELDTGAEVKLSPKEMSRRAAARAGLQLPDLNPDSSS